LHAAGSIRHRPRASRSVAFFESAVLNALVHASVVRPRSQRSGQRGAKPRHVSAKTR
jgi:hypothetical protein